jgi:hypothetical protein
MAVSGVWSPDTLVIGEAGFGGADSFCYLGFLAPLEDADFLCDVTTYIGTSYGSVICLLLVVGYKVREVITEMRSLYASSDIRDLLSMTTRSNENPHEFKRKVEELVFCKMGTVPTLRELYDATNKTLLTVAFNIKKRVLEYMDKTTRPNLLCTEVVVQACNTQDNATYYDASLMRPYHVIDVNSTLGLYINRVEEKRVVAPINDDNVSDRYVYAVMADRINNELTTSQRHVALEIVPRAMSSDTEEIKRIADLLIRGYNAAKVFLFGATKE